MPTTQPAPLSREFAIPLKQDIVRAVFGAGMAAERTLRGARVRIAPEDVQSVLILEYRLPLGCCVHLTPLYEAIKRARPACVVTVATRGLGAALLRHHSWVDHLIETPDALTDILGTARALRGELKRRGVHPDCTVTGASDRRSRIALTALLTGGGWRGGFSEAQALYHRPLVYHWDRSLIANNLRLAELLGCPPRPYEPSVFFSAADAATARALAQEANPDGKPLVLFVTQTSGGQLTGWHDDRFAAVIRHATEQLGCAVALVGTAADAVPIYRLHAATGGLGTSLAGRTGITELAALLALADAVVSLDTGTMHLGRAVGVPMVVIGPSWQKPLEWLPLGLPQVRILRGPDRPDIPPGYQLDEVQAEDAIHALTDLLTAYPPSAASREDRLQRSLSSMDHRRSLA